MATNGFPNYEMECLPWLKENVKRLKFSSVFLLKFNFYQAAEKTEVDLTTFWSWCPNAYKFVATLPEIAEVRFIEWPFNFMLCHSVADIIELQEKNYGMR